jgi:hypothetical protein
VGTHLGSCFCGAVSIEATGEPVEMGYCHCADCRAYSGAPVTAFGLWRAEDVRVTEGAEHLGRFNKRGFSERQFCTRCGGSVLVDHPGLGFTDIPAGRLPTLDFRPSVHLNYASAVLPMRDGLPKLRDMPESAGGSGQTLPE